MISKKLKQAKRFFTLSLLLIACAQIPTGCSSKPALKERGDFYAADASHKLTDETKSPLPEPKGFVSDFAKVLDEETKNRLEKTLSDFRNRAQIDFAVVTVETTGDQSIFDYSLAVARGWSVGAQNPDKAGLLLLVAVNDRKWHIQTSNALRKVLSDKEVGELGAIMNAPFREKKYGEGLVQCVEAFIKQLSERRK